MGLVVCLMLRVVSTQAENGKTKGTETGSGDAGGGGGGWIMPCWLRS